MALSYRHYCRECQRTWYDDIPKPAKCSKCDGEDIVTTYQSGSYKPPYNFGNRYGSTVAVPKEKCWDSDLEILKTCSLMEKKTAIVVLNYEIDLKIKGITEYMGSTEWLGYLTGTWDNEKAIGVITNLIIPEQEVTGISVKVTETVPQTHIIGTVHTHGSGKGAAAFSTTDETYLMGNHPITLLVLSNGYEAKARIKAPCGHLMLIDAQVSIFYPDQKELIDEIKEKITKKSWSPAEGYKGLQGQLPFPYSHEQLYGGGMWDV